MFLASFCEFRLSAQTIQIKLLNGKNGRPLAGKCVNVWVGDGRKEAMALPTNQDGIASLKLTENDSETDIRHEWKACGLLGVINPVVKYSDEIKINTSEVSCEPHTADFSWLAIKAFPSKEVLQSGIVTANTCGKTTASPEPRQIILFVRPLSFWEKMKQ